MAWLSPLPSQGVGQDVFLSGGSTGEESTSKLIQIIRRIHFLKSEVLISL